MHAGNNNFLLISGTLMIQTFDQLPDTRKKNHTEGQLQ
jgi:hypothetical protein